MIVNRQIGGSGGGASGELGAPTVDTSTGIVTATVTKGGVLEEGTSTTLQLSKQAAKTVTPTTSTQTAVAKGKYTTGAVKVAAMPSDSNVPIASGSFTGVEGTSKTFSGLSFNPIGIFLCGGPMGDYSTIFLRTLYHVGAAGTSGKPSVAIRGYAHNVASKYTCQFGTKKLTITWTEDTSASELMDGTYYYVIWGAAA